MTRNKFVIPLCSKGTSRIIWVIPYEIDKKNTILYLNLSDLYTRERVRFFCFVDFIWNEPYLKKNQKLLYATDLCQLVKNFMAIYSFHSYAFFHMLSGSSSRRETGKGYVVMGVWGLHL